MKIVPYNGVEHANFILNSWMVSSKSGFESSESSGDDHYGFLEPYIKSILELPETWCRMAVDEEDQDNYIGYLVSTAGLARAYIHYIYVKQAYRKFGVAKALLEALQAETPKAEQTLYYTTLPNQWKWNYAKSRGWRYDPMWIRNRLYGGNNG